MKREPSIHVTESQLAKILLDEGYPFSDNIAKQILIRAKKYQLSSRKLLASNNKLAQKANVIAKSPLQYSMLMAMAIYNHRRALKHRGIEIAKPNTKDFTIIKTITSQALEAKEIWPELSVQQVFYKYVQAYINFIGPKGKFNLLTLQSKATEIMEYAESMIELSNDTGSDYTTRAYERYNERVIKEIGELLLDYKKIPSKYKFFMEVSKECTKMDIEPEVWIDAQFEGLAWTKAIPEVTQLVGPKAMERLQKYLYQNRDKLGIKNTKDQKQKADNINKLKNLRKLK